MELELNSHVKEGQTVLLTSGSYSDFEVHTLCRAVRGFDLTEECSRFKEKNPGSRYYSASDFMKWLIVDRGLLVELKYRNIYMGDYDLEPRVHDGKGMDRI